MLLHQAFEGFPILGSSGPVIFIIYPLIPWLGVMAVGYAFGALYQLDAQRRRRLLLIIGGIATALFYYSCNQRVWRSVSVVTTEERCLHGPFVFECLEVSTLIAVPIDDSWSSNSRFGFV